MVKENIELNNSSIYLCVCVSNGELFMFLVGFFSLSLFYHKAHFQCLCHLSILLLVWTTIKKENKYKKSKERIRRGMPFFILVHMRIRVSRHIEVLLQVA